MTRPSPEWHAECKRLRAAGSTCTQIAAALGKTLGAVKWVLDENGERAASLHRTRMQRGTYDGVHHAATAIEKHKPRVPSRRGDEWAQMVRDATAAFAAGEIDRAEMMRRLGKGSA